MEKKVLTDEVRNELMGLAPFSTEVVDHFTPDKIDRKKVPEQFIPVFDYKVFSKKEKESAMRIAKNLKDINEGELRECVRKQIVGWKNLWDIGTREEIIFEAGEDGHCKKEIFAHVPNTLCGDILFHIYKASGILRSEFLGLGY